MVAHLGDKIWFKYCGNIVCGNIVDHSPTKQFIKISDVTYEVFKNAPENSKPTSFWFYVPWMEGMELQKPEKKADKILGFKVVEK